ncbi:MAG TPA: glycosyltransferase family 39 protein [Chitinophagaceae bacterium]|nr:glycosyltransferase family 39 protein [Chitinophagaceae bacterium]
MNSPHKYFWLLFLLSLALLFPSLGKAPLWIFDEVRNAECAREMWERNDWIVPTFNGELRTLKPPLHYYFMFGGFEIFGITEWGARFFSAVFGVLTILLTYFFVQWYSTRLHAFITGCVLLASTHFLFQFRMSVPDPYLIFFNTVSLFTAYAYFKEKKFIWIIIAAIAFGLGALAKGPVAIALPALAVVCWLIWEKRLKQLFHWHILVALVITLTVAFPWYILVHRVTNGEWTEGFFFKHNLDRFSEPMEGHGGLFIIVPLFILVGLLPASIFIAESFKGFKNRFKNPLLKLALCVTIAFTVFYSISGTKLPNYPMPCYPFIAVLLAYFIQQVFTNNAKTKIYPFIILLLINIALPIGLYFGIKNEVELKGEELKALFLLILTIGTIASTVSYKRKGFKTAMISLMIVYTIFNIVFLNYLYPAVYKNNPMSKTIGEVKKYENVVAYKIFHPSYTYYLPQRIKVFEQPDSLQQYLQNNQAIIITRQASLPELNFLQLDTVAIHHDLFESSTTSLLTNKKKTDY